MVNESYVSAYTLVTANEGTRPLLCTEGYGAAVNFTCTVMEGSVYFGAYAKYPECEPLNCTAAPPTVENQAPMTSCLSVGLNATKLHNTSCPMQCKAGHQPKNGIDAFTCLYGTYSGFSGAPDNVLPECELAPCPGSEKPQVAGGLVSDCTVQKNGVDYFGSVCTVRCDPGYELVGAATMECEVTDIIASTGEGAPNAKPKFSTPGTCKARLCGSLPTIANGKVGKQECSAGGCIVGDSAEITCDEGYEPKQGTTATVKCGAVAEVSEADVAWSVNDFECVKKAPPPTPAPTDGTTEVVEVFYVKASITITIALPEGVTAEDLKDDADFMDAVKKALSASTGKSVSDIEITDIQVVEARLRRLLAEEAPARRLASGTLKIDFRVKAASAAEAESLKTSISEGGDAFKETFKKTLEENSDVTVESMELSEPEVEVDTITQPAKPSGPSAAADSDDEEEEDSNIGVIIGAVVGGVGGLALLGVCYYMFTKRKGYNAQE
jgi:hypothetical protein